MVSIKGEPIPTTQVTSPGLASKNTTESVLIKAETTPQDCVAVEMDHVKNIPKAAWGALGFGKSRSIEQTSSAIDPHEQSDHAGNHRNSDSNETHQRVSGDKAEEVSRRENGMKSDPQVEAQTSQSVDSATSTTQQPPLQKPDRASYISEPKHTRKSEPPPSGTDHWATERKRLIEKIDNFRKAQTEQDRAIAQLTGHNDRLHSDLTRYRNGYSELKHAKDQQSTQFDKWAAQLKANIQTAENEKSELQGQLAKMTEIISQLNKKGLPLPPDDNYFSQAFDSLIADTRQWARTFTKGQPPLTLEALGTMSLSDWMTSHLNASFLDLQSLLQSTSVGSKVRTRWVETILLRTFTGPLLTERYIGLSDKLYAQCQEILEYFGGSSAEEEQHWSALTNHLITKDDKFLEGQNQAIDNITNSLYEELLPLGGPKKTTWQSLRDLVARVAKLGHLIALLPFRIVGIEVKPGTTGYNPVLMELIDGDMDGGSGESPRVTISLCGAWMKETFDDKGNAVEVPLAERKIYTKARVSCLT